LEMRGTGSSPQTAVKNATKAPAVSPDW
jgi:hypothetical protein